MHWLPLLHGRVWKSKDVMDLCPGGLCPEGFRTMGFFHGLLVLCRYLIASLCAFGGGPLLPGRHPSMDGGGGGDGTSLCSDSWL